MMMVMRCDLTPSLGGSEASGEVELEFVPELEVAYEPTQQSIQELSAFGHGKGLPGGPHPTRKRVEAVHVVAADAPPPTTKRWQHSTSQIARAIQRDWFGAVGIVDPRGNREHGVATHSSEERPAPAR